MVKGKRGRPRKNKVVESRKKQEQPYFQMHDSYTSLLLGIGVVIISAFLLVGFFKSNSKLNRQITEIGAQTTQTPEEPTEVPASTVTESPIPVVSPTLTPTKMPSRLATPSPDKISQNAKKLPATYTVAQDDTLWLVAERFYDSGYNWIDIARENKLADPSHIEVGQKLVIPKVPVKMISATSTGPFIFKSKAITGDTYVIKRGDTLWGIAVLAYGDGFRWPDLAKANNLQNNPGLIHADNVLKIPR